MDEERTDTDENRPAAGAAPEETAVQQGDEGFDDPPLVDLDDPAAAPAGDDRPPRPPIEPESVDPEHAVFVALGAALTVAVVAGLV